MLQAMHKTPNPYGPAHLFLVLKACTKAALSFIVNPTLLTLPSLASASPMRSSTFCSSKETSAEPHAASLSQDARAVRVPIRQSCGSVDLVFGNSDADAGSGTRQEVPEEEEPLAWNGGCDVRWRVAEADGEDVDVWRALEHGRAERQDGLAVGGAALGEDGDDSAGVLPKEVAELDKLGISWWRGPDGSQGHGSGLDQANALQLAGTWVRDGEDGGRRWRPGRRRRWGW